MVSSTILYSCLLMSIAASLSTTTKTIYGVPNSGWRSPQWNWGSAVGTGHDCARISRQTYATKQARQDLIHDLLAGNENKPSDFEEVKLALALFLQKSQWDGSDGSSGNYGDVLAYMAEAERYEVGEMDECMHQFISDMGDRFQLLNPSDTAAARMACLSDESRNLNSARRKCCGLVLEAMGFVDKGP